MGRRCVPASCCELRILCILRSPPAARELRIGGMNLQIGLVVTLSKEDLLVFDAALTNIQFYPAFQKRVS